LFVEERKSDMNKNTKTDWWRMRAAQIDKMNIAQLAKQLNAKSESEAVRRAVAMALQVTNPQRDQFPNVQPQT